MGSRDGTRAWCDTGQPRQRFQKYRWLADRCPRVALRHGFARHTSEETTTRSGESGSPDASAFVITYPYRSDDDQLGNLIVSTTFSTACFSDLLNEHL